MTAAYPRMCLMKNRDVLRICLHTRVAGHLCPFYRVDPQLRYSPWNQLLSSSFCAKECPLQPFLEVIYATISVAHPGIGVAL